ncbi:MAG: RluA family pseudouridine synthase [Candidatus Omnitrophica bacterium]|nr:RluA family pseudouridine synthase [Candidatus Omnitrophota bacterium]
MNIPVVYEDEWLLIVDKPSGLLVIPSPRNERRTLTSILDEDAKEKGVSYRLHPCHRLDRETSGLIVYAKGKSIQKKMMDLFGQKKVRKIYVAFIQGKLSQRYGEISNAIEGAPALTKYSVLETKKDFSIVEIFPFTGRTNQIRIHFKQIGHPLVGESKFAFRKDYALRAKRLCLHAKILEFPHPVTGQPVKVSAPLPKDLEEFLRKQNG